MSYQKVQFANIWLRVLIDLNFHVAGDKVADLTCLSEPIMFFPWKEIAIALNGQKITFVTRNEKH
jgi:hypothetical protein